MKNDKQDMRVLDEVFVQIKESVGNYPAETGGPLFGCLETNTIKVFHFDSGGKTTGGSYYPDIEFCNQKLKEEHQKGNYFMGFVHSHPQGFKKLSEDHGNGTGDLGYIKSIFEATPHLEQINVPIVISKGNGAEFEFIPYISQRENPEDYYKACLTKIIDPSTKSKKNKNVPLTELPWKKLRGAVDINLMKRTRITCVGVGGAMGLVENIVRTGVYQLTLIDFDHVDHSNVITQGYNLSDVGKRKVDVIKERIENINPSVEVVSHSKRFQDITSKSLKKLGEKTDLLLMMTDSFEAQKFGNLFSLKHSIPAIYAQIYERARGAEITFFIPGVTPGCQRCATSPRYKAYDEGYKNNIGSEGSTVFQSDYLNSVLGSVLLAVLHNNTKGHEFSNWFGKEWKRNLIQLRLHPDYGSRETEGTHFSELSRVNNRLIGFDAQWLSVEPDSLESGSPCPDCGGFGDHEKTKEFIELLTSPTMRTSQWLVPSNI